MDLFTKRNSSCNPARLILTLWRELSRTSYTLLFVRTIDMYLVVLDLPLHQYRGNLSGKLENAAESNFGLDCHTYL